MYCTKRATFPLVISLLSSSLLSMESTSIDLSQKDKLVGETTIRCEDNSLVFYKMIVNARSKESYKKEIGRISDVPYFKNLLLFFLVKNDLLIDVKRHIAHLLARLVLGDTLDCNFELSKKLEEPSHCFLLSKVSPNGKVILTILEKGATLWDIALGKIKRELLGHTGPVMSLAISPDGRIALTGSRDKTACLWNIDTGEPIKVLRGHDGAVNAVGFSADGEKIITGSETTARIWNVSDGSELVQLPGHTRAIRSVAFSSDKKFVLTGSGDEVILWDSETGEKSKSFKGRKANSLMAALFSADDKSILFATEDNITYLWDTATGERLAKPRDFSLLPSQFLGVSLDGVTSLTRELGREESLQTEYVWDTITGKLLAQLQCSSVVHVEALASDKKSLLGLKTDIVDTAEIWTMLPCEASNWLLNNINPLQAWFIIRLLSRKVEHGGFTIFENSLEYEIFLSMPEFVRDYLVKWYAVKVKCVEKSLVTPTEKVEKDEKLIIFRRRNGLSEKMKVEMMERVEAVMKAKKVEPDESEHSKEWSIDED